jgi:hypothetical protein
VLPQDWLITALACWHHHVGRLPYGAAPQRGDVDAELAAAPALAPLATLVYALLRSVPLSPDAAAAADGDPAAYLRLLWSCLPPDQLTRAVYPLLLAFDGPDDKPLRQCPLSRAALHGGSAGGDATGSCRGDILVMDAFHAVLVVQRAAAAAAGSPWPPPPDSALRKTIQELKTTRRLVPEVRCTTHRHHTGRQSIEVSSTSMSIVDVATGCRSEPDRFVPGPLRCRVSAGVDRALCVYR